MDIAWRAQRRARSKGESVGDANQTRRDFFKLRKMGVKRKGVEKMVSG